MNVKIGDYCIRSDQYSCWIEREIRSVNKKTGKESVRCEKYAGYCKDFADLLESFAKRRVKGSDVETVKEALAEFSKAESEIRKMVRALKGVRK